MKRARYVAVFAFLALLGAAPQSSIELGRNLYDTHCITCHGADLRGTLNGPSLLGVGAASVDFWVSSGRMPAIIPWVESLRKTPLFTQRQTDALTAYVTSVAPGGPPIPVVTLGENLARGRALYERNCQQCHGAYGQGEMLGNGWTAPSLMNAPINAVVEAMRVGPMPMPRWSERTLSPSDANAIARYVNVLQTHPDDRGGLGLEHIGPVAEGIVAWIVGMGILLGFIRAIGTHD